MPSFESLALTFRLALIVTSILFVIGTPIAWWLAFSKSRLRPIVEAITAMPLVLPPTVLGFYLLLAFNPEAPIGGFWMSLTGSTLTFSFTGLVVASVIYSLPFMVQPLQASFENIGRGPFDDAASLGASPWDGFLSVMVPLARRGFLTAGVLTFAHTIGEFGVVLMVGGNIPGETKLISIDIYEKVETLAYGEAHILAGILVAFSFITLLSVYVLNASTRERRA